MPQLRITHATRYAYHRPVRLLPHRLMVRPQDSHDLRLREATLAVTPPPKTTAWSHDVFGNSICTLDWEGGAPTASLEVVSTLDVTHFPAGPALPRATLAPSAERHPFSYEAGEIPDLARLAERHLPDPEGRVDAWARRVAEAAGGRTLDLLERMTRAIRDELTYAVRDAEGTRAPVETLAAGSGACRDFALLMMEAARALGFAARFVSGYLYDPSQTGMVGGGATHAWAAIYLPGAGWVEFDPTNGLIAGQNLIRVAVTRTPEQAVPMGGGFLGDSSDAAGLTVDVAVEVEAPPEAAPLLPDAS